MMEKVTKNPEIFTTPEQELDFLRQKVAEKEKELSIKKESPEHLDLVKEVVHEYKVANPPMSKDYKMPEESAEAVILELTPEAHDEKIAELLAILQEKGVKNTLSIVAKMNNPHISDDFERFLVQYIKSGSPITGLKEKDPIYKALKMTLYEVTLPQDDNEENNRKTLKELLSGMEQFYAGMLSVSDNGNTSTNYFTFELAVSNHSNEFVFYIGVSDAKKNLFEKHILSIFHNAVIEEKKDDYNIFCEGGEVVGSYVVPNVNSVFPLKMYDQFDHDPLNVILNSFSKIDKDGEGASIQILFNATQNSHAKEYNRIYKELLKGKKVKDALYNPNTILDHAKDFFKDIFISQEEKEKAKNKEKEDRVVDQLALDNVKRKMESQIALVNIRILASSKTAQDAKEILSDIESSFNQFENATGNKPKFVRPIGKKLDKFIKDFTFRLYNKEQDYPISLKELTGIMHFPSTVIKTSPQLKISKASTAPVPLDLPDKGTLLGINKHRGVPTEVYLSDEDRLRHFYTIGQTGTGKTTLLKNMITQDILKGNGVCMIDPHGTDIEDVLSIIPKERYEDVIYFDPSHTERPMALNMLEYDPKYPEQKTFVVNEMLSIFNKLFDMKVAGGPMFEQYFRNAVLLVMEDVQTGNTLLDVSRVLAQKSYREMKLANCKNPIVIQFWREVAEKAGGEAALSNVVPYITSKFDVFLSNDVMRPIIAQETSSLNFRDIMDTKKILLVNLSKGRLGDINAHLIGLILVGKILMSALSRVDSLDKNPPPFYLYIDEFQNITTSSISTILSEARKYKLSLNIAHQFIAQLEEPIRDAVFGNVGSIASFRIGADDAEYLEKQFAPVFTAKDLMNIENRHAYLKILANGRPVKPFDIATVAPNKGDVVNKDNIKKLSHLKYGRDRQIVEREIMNKYQTS
jgi:hypothetical protein